MVLDAVLQGGQALSRAMDVVDTVANHPNGISVGELQALTDLPQSTLYRVVQVLELRGLLLRAYGRVFPGPALAVFFATIGASIAGASRELLGEMSAELRSSTVLGIAGGAHGHCLVRDFSANRIFQSVRPGSRFPLTIGAMGKALLAFSSTTTQEYAIAASRHLTAANGQIVARPVLYRELTSARQMGYWISRNEVQSHTGGVFAPVMAGSKAIGVLGAVTTEHALTEAEAQSMTRSVVRHARAASKLIHRVLHEPERV